MSALTLMREDLRDFDGYRSARSDTVDGDVWLNANEAAWANAADPGAQVRRYPTPQPDALRDALASLYGVPAPRLLVGRGSDEAIDLLVRAFCAPGGDAVVVTPPVFGMYAVSARLHGARVVAVPLQDGDVDFRVDLGAVEEAARRSRAKLVFLCSPGNPAGGVLPRQDVLGLARALDGRALVVVDEAYVEFAGTPTLATAVGDRPNLVVLRTLSKAHALAGARIGCAIASEDIVGALRRCQAPYPLPAPSVQLALRALAPNALARTRRAVESTCMQRERMRLALARMPGVRRVYPSQANFLLVRFDDAGAAYATLLAAGVAVRDMRAQPQLDDALRITIGSASDNDRVLAALEALAP